MAFRLCLEIGCEHPDYLLARLTSRQVAEWWAYFAWVASDTKPQKTPEQLRNLLSNVLDGCR